MIVDRRNLLLRTGAAAAAGALVAVDRAAAQTHDMAAMDHGAMPMAPAPAHTSNGPLDPRYTPVRTLNGWTLPWKMVNGAKEFHLVAEEIVHEFGPGSKATCWGYNGSTPGPTIEAVEGDRVRIYVTNRLYNPEDEGRVPHDQAAIAYDWELQHK